MASRTSAVSQRSSGTMSLYKAVGETYPPGDLLSFRSALKLSGDELLSQKQKLIFLSFVGEKIS